MVLVDLQTLTISLTMELMSLLTSLLVDTVPKKILLQQLEFKRRWTTLIHNSYITLLFLFICILLTPHKSTAHLFRIDEHIPITLINLSLKLVGLVATIIHSISQVVEFSSSYKILSLVSFALLFLGSNSTLLLLLLLRPSYFVTGIMS